MLDRLLHPLRKRYARLLLKTVPPRHPWDRIRAQVPLACYGIGAVRDFRWYFEGKSRIEVHDLSEIREWLLGCRYVRDLDQFASVDYWQHPCHFERVRRGDCEDFSVWAWRKMVELGMQAELVAGRCLSERHGPGGHAWVMFVQGNARYLLDPVLRTPEHMARRFEEVESDYVPEFSVDAGFRHYVYGGYLDTLRTA